MALAVASQIVVRASRSHRDWYGAVEWVLQDMPINPRHRNGITDNYLPEGM
jgi:hypothetical protein